ACDTGDFGGDTCASAGFVSGNLGCAGDCSLDTSLCSPRCGDGVTDPGEDCDDANIIAGDLCGSSCTFEVTPIAEVEPNDDGTPQIGALDFNAANAMGPSPGQAFTSDVIINGALSPDGDEDEVAIANPTAAPFDVRARTFT